MTPNFLLGIGFGFIATSLFFVLPIPEWLKLLLALGAQVGLIVGVLGMVSR